MTKTLTNTLPDALEQALAQTATQANLLTLPPGISANLARIKPGRS